VRSSFIYATSPETSLRFPCEIVSGLRPRKDALLIADTWEKADSLNTRIHGDRLAAADALTVVGAGGLGDRCCKSSTAGS
jgi:hypothetical protein